MTYLVNRYCLIKNPEKNTMAAALVVVCARVFVRRPAAAVLGNLSVLAHLVTAPSNVLWFPTPSSRFPFSPVPKNKMLLAAFGTGSTTKILAGLVQ